MVTRMPSLFPRDQPRTTMSYKSMVAYSCSKQKLLDITKKDPHSHIRYFNQIIFYDEVPERLEGYFMVKEGIVLGHKISKNGIEVDKAKFDVIAKLPHPTTVKGVQSFLGHVEAKALPTNDARVVCKLLKSLFPQFGTPRAIISDRGTHFSNDYFSKVMLKYGVTHRLATAYHPQTSGQVEFSNRGLK
ncbi:reverse transcriptase domain-containing protein [Tanacetum coccineum]|uniref:Reverse transcriptase domain-containing protein n=1 Tax=Tanacetum coccineum TaxID=301880 RepID=A0ABQ5AGI7_9ASTR